MKKLKVKLGLILLMSYLIVFTLMTSMFLNILNIRCVTRMWLLI